MRPIPGFRVRALAVPAIAAAALLSGAGHAAAAASIEQSCQDAAAKAAVKYVSSALKAIAACEAGRADGSISPATNCRPADGAIGDATTATAVSSAETTLGSAISSKCSAANFALMSFGGPCSTVTDATTLTACIAGDAHATYISDLVETVYAASAPVANAGARVCMEDTLAAASKYVSSRLKVRNKCAKSVVSGKTDICPDAKSNAKLDKALAKFKDSLTACTATALGNFTPGFPCDLYVNATIPGTTTAKYGRCLSAAAAGAADLGSEATNPLSGEAPFAYGVAAGDQTDTTFMAWTRTSDTMTNVSLQVASDPEFATIVATVPMLSPSVAGDGTVKTDVTGLTASTQYYYRFQQGSATSRTGRVKTAPAAASTAGFRFSFTGDANAFFQPFTVLEQTIEDNPDLWLFIGDTIYGDDPRSGTGVAAVRSDYHTKYKENRSDRSMRDILASFGTYTIWDDHETTNDIWGTNPATAALMLEGSLAFRDYMPIREDGGDPMQLYRSFKWGNVAEFFLLDTRQYRDAQATVTEPQCTSGVCSVTQTTDCHADSDCLMGESCMKGTCSETDDPCSTQMDCDMIMPGQTCDENLGDSTPNATCMAEVEAPGRDYLGAAQLAWLENGLLNSTATFKFVMNGPLLSEIQFVPYDRWEGYAAERDSFLNFVQSNAIKNVVFLSTDIHAAIQNTDVNGSGIREYVSGAVGMDPIARELPPSLVSLLASLPLIFPTISYYDLDRFNVATVDVSQTQMTITWRDASGQQLNTATIPAE